MQIMRELDITSILLLDTHNKEIFTKQSLSPSKSINKQGIKSKHNKRNQNAT
jgi:hypothetical protein